METVFVPVVVASVLSELYLEQQVWYYIILKFVSRSESILMRGLGVDTVSYTHLTLPTKLEV